MGLPGLAFADEILTWGEVNQEHNDFVLADNGTNETFSAVSDISVNVNSALDTVLPSILYATLTLNATTHNTATGSGTLDEGGWSGTFSIIDDADGSNILSGSFGTQYSDLSGHGKSLTFQDSTPPATEVYFSSDYLDFNTYLGDLGFAWSMTNVTPIVSKAADGFLISLTAAGSGSFSATPLPPVVTPEPDTLVLLSGAALLGIGLALRKRRLRPVL
jgi:hypothetical protein